MKLCHFSKDGDLTLDKLIFKLTDRPNDKPDRALWLSDEDGNVTWSRWCIDENFNMENLDARQEVRLVEAPSILYLRNPRDILEFHRQFFTPLPPYKHLGGIVWTRVNRMYDAVVISPYQWGQRLEVPWYYTWDVASAVILAPAAIESIGPATPVNINSEGRVVIDMAA